LLIEIVSLQDLLGSNESELLFKPAVPFPTFSNRNEVELMLKRGTKLEIEALASISLTFLADVYLPEKIKSKQWLL